MKKGNLKKDMFYVVMEGCSFSEEGVGYVLQNAETVKKFRKFAFFFDKTQQYSSLLVRKRYWNYFNIVVQM